MQEIPAIYQIINRAKCLDYKELDLVLIHVQNKFFVAFLNTRSNTLSQGFYFDNYNEALISYQAIKKTFESKNIIFEEVSNV